MIDTMKKIIHAKVSQTFNSEYAEKAVKSCEPLFNMLEEKLGSITEQNNELLDQLKEKLDEINNEKK